MKKLIIKESVVNGKMSKAELLLNVLCKSNDDNFIFIGLYYDHFIKYKPNEEIENLCDDLGYWQDTGNYDISLQKAIKKLNRLTKWLESMILHFDDITGYDLLMSVNDNSKMELKTRIKLLLYIFANYKNNFALDKKIERLTGLNYKKIRDIIYEVIEGDNSNDYMTVFNNIQNNIQGLIYYYSYYIREKYFFINGVKDLMVDKINRKNKTRV